jgi:hypothetical protein
MARYEVTLKVESHPGANVRDVAVELCQLADRVGVMCETKFNDVLLVARPGCNPLRLVEAYEELVLRPAREFKVTQAN